ncbi:MAG: cation transporter [Bacteroidota bacterium]
MNSLSEAIEQKAKGNQSVQYWLRMAWYASLVTIIYNVIEGGIATVYGYSDDTLALFGFGVDSFVEVISGLGIAHMVARMRGQQQTEMDTDAFERRALQITGSAFYLLVAGLVISSAWRLYTGARPETTMVGIIISSLSIATMYGLYWWKMKIGRAIQSDPIISDARCTLTCFYLSFILLGSSLLYEGWGIPYVDEIGALGIAWFAFKEGREAFEKAEARTMSCACE